MNKCFWRVLSLALILCLLGGTANAAGICKAETEEKKIALTFDDGPSPLYTEKLLALLEKHGVKATFFIIGENAAENPEPVRAIAAAGHEIGNHTYTHAHLNKLSAERVKEEIEKTEKILTELAGTRPHLFRPPGGLTSPGADRLIEEAGLRSILWSVDTRDWSLPPASRIIRTVREEISPGAILLFHDLNRKGLPTLDALEILLPELLAQGYEFVTVSELLAG